MSTLGSARRIPLIGDSIARVGQIIDIAEQPCTLDPIIVVEAVFHDAPKMLWSIFKPDTMDLTTERAGLRHKKKPKKGFNIFDELESSVPVPKGKVGQAVFHLGSMAERIGWYVLIVDATTEFLVNWTSTVYEWSGCDNPNGAFCAAYGNENYVLYQALPWHPLPVFVNQQFVFPFLSTTGSFHCPAGFNATFSGTLRYKSVPGTVYGVGVLDNIRLVDRVNNLYWEMPDAVDSNDGYKTTTLTIRSWELLNPAHSFEFWAECTVPGWFSFEGSFGQLTGHKDKGLLADP